MTYDWRVRDAAFRAAVREKGMAAAREWRDGARPATCRRCQDTGIIKTWGGLAGQGGKIGPCPNCQVEAARRFADSINPFGEGRHFAEPRGEDHGRP